MTAGHVLRRLVDPLQLLRVVNGPAGAVFGRQHGAVAASDADLTHDDGSVSALRVGVHVFATRFKQFHLLPCQTLVFRERVIVAANVHCYGGTTRELGILRMRRLRRRLLWKSRCSTQSGSRGRLLASKGGRRIAHECPEITSHGRMLRLIRGG